MDKELSNINEEQLYSDISQLIEVTQQRTLHEINRAGVLLYWHIGTPATTAPANALQ